jgi:hypothetical protein
MIAYLIRIMLVVLTAVILVSAYQTGTHLAVLDVSSPEAAQILMKHYRVSTKAAFCRLVPSIFLFDALLKRKKTHTNAETQNRREPPPET